MPKRVAGLDSKFDLSQGHQILTGAQAVVRLLLMQKDRDRRAGLNTAGYVSGYRGSPIAGLEGAMLRAGETLSQDDIRFQTGLNEDLAATAIWGTQQAQLRGEGKFDGVFGLWYGKGPGVDRTGDVFRHANHAGTSAHGGVLALMGDDHTCESSTSAHQSEFAFVDCMSPVLNPGGVQEILDFGLIGYALSRYAGVWVGLKCVKDNIESTATVDGRIDRIAITLPGEDEFCMPPGGLNIRLGDQALDKEARLHDFKRSAILAFARANGIDKLVMSGGTSPRIGIVSTGKSYLDVRGALDLLGIDEVQANTIGIRLYKVGMTWPLEPQGLARFANGLDTILVVEEKRSLIESQIKEQLYDSSDRPRVLGKKDEFDNWLFPAKGALEPTEVAIAVGERLIQAELGGEGVKRKVSELKQLRGNKPVMPEAFVRTPYFCAGCPHNTSTRVPDGAHAYAGIDCHYMAQWMDRSTEGWTHMGGEGANWIGEAPFSKRGHVFQNLGDGTYIHSGSLAVRAAVAAGTNITYKVLYNDAVAMTGGQALDGGMTVANIAAQLVAEGVGRIDVVTDEPEKYGASYSFTAAFSSNTPQDLPKGVKVHHRRDLMAVQKELAEIGGVTAIIYDQTCASEKRRRRKRGAFPDPNKRVFINPDVCEGCGDCGVKSNCVAVLPLDTDLGRKRQIDQSSCNKDLSCIEGFCPSFVTLHGARPKRVEGIALGGGGTADKLASVPNPIMPSLGEGSYAIIMTGVGGTGVVTISAILGQAAHIEGKGFGSIDMAGLAQKGGAVACHVRIAASPKDISAIRVGVAGADLVLGGDLVVTASNKVLEAIKPDHTAVLVNTYEMTTGDFTRDPLLNVPGQTLHHSIADRVGDGQLTALDAHEYAVRLFGDSIASNMFLLGMAYQLGHVPVGAEAIEEAIRLNGAAVEMNHQAFRYGRLAAYDRAALDQIIKPQGDAGRSHPETLAEIVARRVKLLTDYQDADLASRYQAKIDWIAKAEAAQLPGETGLAVAAAKAYYKLLAYKDEYEVARLFTSGAFAEQVAAQFDGVKKIEFHLAPPLISWKRDKVSGHPYKMAFGPWMMSVMRSLAKLRTLRGTRWDIFGYTAERRQERQMIRDYERLLDEVIPRLSMATHATLRELVGLPLEIKGFGHIKAAHHAKAKQRQAELLKDLDRPDSPLKLAAE
ncbi:MAG: indolepyruvate ferredoxin oxidoreductase family protein [Hyphomicrobiaceae bacterium]